MANIGSINTDIQAGSAVAGGFVSGPVTVDYFTIDDVNTPDIDELVRDITVVTVELTLSLEEVRDAFKDLVELITGMELEQRAVMARAGSFRIDPMLTLPDPKRLAAHPVVLARAGRL